MTAKEFAAGFACAHVVYSKEGHSGAGFYLAEDEYRDEGGHYLTCDEAASLLAELHAVVVEDDHFGYPPLTGGE